MLTTHGSRLKLRDEAISLQHTISANASLPAKVAELEEQATKVCFFSQALLEQQDLT